MDPIETTPDADDPWDAALSAAFGEGAGEAAADAVPRPADGAAPGGARRIASRAPTGAGIVRPASDEPPPDLPPRFRIVGELARGGMGVVWKVHDATFGRDVALKVLRSALADRPDRARRFVEEAQVAGQLEHPGIVPLHEIGIDARRRPWFAMRLVEGETLASRLARTPPGAGREALLPAFEAVCHAVGYAHARGVVHRDLKPSNVILGAHGEVQVLDWGLAKVLSSVATSDAPPTAEAPPTTAAATPETATAEGFVIGTPGYLSPEQARGEAARVDARADVFALGSMLCELLTGEPAFRGPRDASIVAAAAGDVTDATARLGASGADPALVALALGCLAPDRTLRPRDGSQVAATVAACRAEATRRARAAESEAAAARARAGAERRSKRLALGLAAAVVAFTVGGALLLGARVRERQRRSDSVAARVEDAAEAADAALGAGDLRGAAGLADQAIALASDDDAPPTARSRATAVRARTDDATQRAERIARRAAEDTATVRRLDDVRAELIELSEGPYPLWSGAGGFLRERAEAQYAAAFRAHGLDVRGGARDATAQAVRASPIRERLTAALDTWAYVVTDYDARDPQLDRLVRAVDDDPVRSRLRADASLDAVLREAAALDVATATEDQVDVVASFLRYYGRDAERAALLQRVHARRPEDVRTTLRLAFVEQADGVRGFRRATRLLTAACALAPRSATTRALLGLALAVTGETAAARTALDEALRLDPDTWEAHATLADLAGATGDDAARTRHLAAAVALRPRQPVFVLDLADAEAREGRVDDAIARLVAHAREAPWRRASDPEFAARLAWGERRADLRALEAPDDSTPGTPARVRDALGRAWILAAEAPDVAAAELAFALRHEPARALPRPTASNPAFDRVVLAGRAAARATDPRRATAHREDARRGLEDLLEASARAATADPAFAGVQAMMLWSALRGHRDLPWLADGEARRALPHGEALAWEALAVRIEARRDALARD